MPKKYPLLEPKKIISALSKRGFLFISQRGSHAKYSNGKRTAIIPMHETADLELEDFISLL